MRNDKTVYYTWISQKLGVGAVSFKKLISVFGSVERIYKCTDYSFLKLTDKQIESLMSKDLFEAEKSLFESREKGFFTLTYGDDTYPKKLLELSNPPAILYCKGTLPDFDSTLCVGIVGTRNPSSDALSKTNRLSSELSRNGAFIISGIAGGIDSEAHIASLRQGGFTVGVSGVGAGHSYPAENNWLYNEMYKKGLVICEHSPNDKVEQSSFPIRNRIISALSDALVMMEAPEKSGAVITAKKSLSLNKPVFVPRGDFEKNAGGIKLYEQGALPLGDYREILNFDYGSIKGVSIAEKPKAEAKQPYPQLDSDEKKPVASAQVREASNFQSSSILSSKDEMRIPSGLSPMERDIFVFISNNDSPSTDKIISSLGLSSAAVVSSVSILEIYGYVKRMPGDKWIIV